MYEVSFNVANQVVIKFQCQVICTAFMVRCSSLFVWTIKMNLITLVQSFLLYFTIDVRKEWIIDLL